MKKTVLFILIVNLIILTISCTSAGNTTQISGQANANIRFLNPEDIIGKKLIGSDNSGSYKFVFSLDGSFEYTLNENVYYGKWSFDEKKDRMFRYFFDWFEDEKRREYIGDFAVGLPNLNESEIYLNSHWLHGYYPFSKTLTVEE